ncbi:MAG: hypothetical protein GOV15_04225 [Candidatus Diapherotrites archaeon]|nr:hypothetical protein [Candidatus Diapherotrites archaeon]
MGEEHVNVGRLISSGPELSKIKLMPNQQHVVALAKFTKSASKLVDFSSEHRLHLPPGKAPRIEHLILKEGVPYLAFRFEYGNGFAPGEETKIYKLPTNKKQKTQRLERNDFLDTEPLPVVNQMEDAVQMLHKFSQQEHAESLMKDLTEDPAEKKPLRRITRISIPTNKGRKLEPRELRKKPKKEDD